MRLLITLFSFLVVIQLVQAQAPLINTHYDAKKKTTAKVTALFSRLPTSGYYPIRLEVKNGQKSERKWKIKCASLSDNYGNRNSEPSEMESEYEYTCPANSSKTFDILVPIVTSFPNARSHTISSSLTFTLSSDGNTLSETINSSQQIDKPAVLLSSSLFIHHSAILDRYLRSHHSGYGVHDAAYASSVDTAHTPSDWKSYSGYDAFVCTDTEWNSMGKAEQNAVLTWNRLGGKVLILRLNSASNFKTLGIAPDSTDNSKKVHHRSFGTVLIQDIVKVDASDIPNIIRDNVETSHSNPPKINSILTDFDSGAWSIQNSMGKLSFNPIILILILITFGVLVGPVNLFVFAKAGQRHKLFITTPIIAIGASLILILLIIFQDGFGGHGKRIQLIEIRADHGENKAYVKQEQIARTGVVLGSSFETSSPTYITPVPIMPSRYARVTRDNQGGSAKYIAHHGANGLAVSGDWFQSRSEHGYYLESVIATRGRVTLKSNTSAPVLNSSFDYKIDAILYRDEDGEFWKTGILDSGKSEKLKTISATQAQALIKSYTKQLSKSLSDQLMEMYQRKGHFVAFSEEAPAIETLDSINWQQTTSIITGPVVR